MATSVSDPSPRQRFLRGPGPWILAVVLTLWLGFGVISAATAPEELSYSEFVSAVGRGELADSNLSVVTIGNRTNQISGERRVGNATRAFTTTYNPEISAEQIRAWLESGAIGNVAFDAEQTGALTQVLFTVVPFILILGIFFLLMQNMQGGGRGVMSFGRAKPKMVEPDAPSVTFADVAGADSAVDDLREIKDFLAKPEAFVAMGAKIPKGVLLYGPPGTGKTLLARAVAGEAGVPFFSISGSDFVEMFVGVGASRVRDLFAKAKQQAPAIIFVDEIDAVGRHRGAGMGGGHDEREQTLNQLLVEMDGFDQRDAVILIAATNRPDILDPALLRPGRFDRQIVVDRPDISGREAILAVHAKGKPFDDTVDLSTLARATPGFTGADLANLLNEGALLAARRKRDTISMDELQEAIERVIAGPQRPSRLMRENERRIVAFHEAGHALVGYALPNTDPVHKVTIIPRGQALGFTMQLPTDDKVLTARSELIDRLAVMMGGRVAEEIIVGDFTTGAGDDIRRATDTAKQMVTQFGMSLKLGPMTFGQQDHQPFLGRDYGHQADYSASIAAEIDTEVRLLLDEAHDEALEILVENRGVLEALAERLLEIETVDRDGLEELFASVVKRPSRALHAPDVAVAPAAVVQAMRRLAPGNGIAAMRSESGDHA